MKKLILMTCLFLIGAYFFPKLQIEQAYTPELFGGGTMLTLSVFPYGNRVGIIFNESYGFIFSEKTDGIFIKGKMTHVLGSPITDADKPISFLKHYSDNEKRFTGWIYFRGHERPFCGSQLNQSLPVACRWR